MEMEKVVKQDFEQHLHAKFRQIQWQFINDVHFDPSNLVARLDPPTYPTANGKLQVALITVQGSLFNTSVLPLTHEIRGGRHGKKLWAIIAISIS